MSETARPCLRFLNRDRARILTYVQPLMPQSIAAQLTGLVAISVLVGVILLGTTIWFLFDPPARADSPVFAAARITEITHLMRAAASSAEADRLLTTIRRSGLDVKRIAMVDLVPSTVDVFSSRFAMRPLAAQHDIELLTGLRGPSSSPSQIVTRLDYRSGLVFNIAINPWPMFIPSTALLLMITVFSVLLLSIYAIRWVTAPLADIANAAASFGRSPHTHAALSPRGPRKIT